MKHALITAAFVVVATGANAASCESDFEREVFELRDLAADFQDGNTFREYGFGTGGPFNGWLVRFKALRDQPNETHIGFLRKHGFTVSDVYNVAFESIKGRDEWYEDINREIQSAERCE